MRNYILIGLSTLSLGLLIGYLVFGSTRIDNVGSGHQDHDHSLHDNDGMEEQTWTCSMHPQIRQPEPGDCPICGMDLIPLDATSSDDPTVLEMTEEAIALANIQTTTIGIGQSNRENALSLSGRVKSDERLVASQVAHVPGRIERLYISFTGENVVTGQKLADIYSPDLITAQRELIEALSLQDVNPSLVEAARNKLRFWKIGDDFINRVENEKSIQEIFTLRADATGVVTNRLVAVGDYVQVGEPLFNLVNLRKVWVLFDAYEDDLGKIELGDEINFSTPALTNRSFTTRVTFIDPVIDPITRTASVRTEISNPNGVLKPEMLVYGRLFNSIEGTQGALYVPKSAVLWTGTRSVVYVKIPDSAIPSFQYREVEIGESVGDAYVVLAGLEVGEEVVTYGSFTIDAAAQLNNQSSMMKRNVGVNGEEPQEESIPDFQESTPLEFQEQLAHLVAVYFNLKDALVASDQNEAADAALSMVPALEQINMSLITGDAHQYWMEQQIAIKAHSQQLAELTELDAQREQFDFISAALINSMVAFGTSGNSIYVQYCPMAFDNEGANWLAAEEQINNPYFGDAMLRCGIIETTIDAGEK